MSVAIRNSGWAMMLTASSAPAASPPAVHPTVQWRRLATVQAATIVATGTGW
jgi:hypothetical protein